MSKRNKIVAVICIVIAAVSFMGGMVYKYEDYEPIVKVIEYDISKHKFRYDFQMPLDIETANIFLDWAILYHQVHIDLEVFTEEMPLELHQGYILMYGKIRERFMEFEKEWGENE